MSASAVLHHHLLFIFALIFAGNHNGAFASTVSVATVSIDDKDYQEMMSGVVQGALSEDVSPNCFVDGQSVMNNLEFAMDELLKKKETTRMNIEEGIKLMGEAVQEAARDKIREDCQEKAINYEELLKMTELLSHPLSFLYRAKSSSIIVNHVTITTELEKVMEAWDQQPKDFYTVGYNIGEILTEVFAGYLQWTTKKNHGVFHV